MSNKFNAGDVVGLKSGGPIMTVNAVGVWDCSCIWFGDQLQLCSGNFNHAALELVDLSKFPVEYSIRGQEDESTTTG